jgi:hypothetical protein
VARAAATPTANGVTTGGDQVVESEAAEATAFHYVKTSNRSRNISNGPTKPVTDGSHW